MHTQNYPKMTYLLRLDMQENQSRKRKVPQSHDAKFLLDENVLPNFEKFLNSFSIEIVKENFIILKEDGIILEKK